MIKNIKVVDIENKNDDIEDETLDNEDTKKKTKNLLNKNECTRIKRFSFTKRISNK